MLDRAVNDELLAVLSMPSVYYSMVYNDADSFQALYMQTDSQRNLFQQYGEVLQLDCTCKVVDMSCICLTCYL